MAHVGDGLDSTRVEDGLKGGKEPIKQQIGGSREPKLPGNQKAVENGHESEQREEEWTPRCASSEVELQQLLEEITTHKRLPVKARPKEPRLYAGMCMRKKLHSIQQFISGFEYNHTQENYFRVRKDLGMKRIVSTAKEIIREALPIKCIEAVFLGCYLTNEFMDVNRLPVRFQSTVAAGHVYRHIVLAVEHKGIWGAIGLSRKNTLMYKELKYPSLASLIADYRAAYTACGHSLEIVSVGLPFGRDLYSAQPIHWRALTLNILTMDNSQVCIALNRYWAKIGMAEQHVNIHGSIAVETLLHEKFNIKDSYYGTATATAQQPSSQTNTITIKPTIPMAWENMRSPPHPGDGVTSQEHAVKVITLDGVEQIYAPAAALDLQPLESEPQPSPDSSEITAKATGATPSQSRDTFAV